MVELYPDGNQYNGTHVRIDGIFHQVVNCIFKNDTINDTESYPIPIFEYRNLSAFQSLFVEHSLNHFERYSCFNSKVNCDCINEEKYTIGYKCVCSYKTSYAKKFFNETTKRFSTWCENFHSLCEKCHPRNTAKCIISNKTELFCKCITGYDSFTLCFDQFNACITAPEGSSLTGNEACRIHENNTCVPFLSFQKYFCQCFYPNKENKDLGFPNCMGRKLKKCDSILCVNGGTCDSSLDPKCICKKGFSGKYCEFIQYTFVGTWTPWSSCYPDCGNFGLRSSEAVCDGPHHIYCSGIIRKWERCAAISCDMKLLSRVDNKTIQGLRFELTKLLTLTSEEYLALVYILSVGGFATGLIYIYIVELIRVV